MRIYPFGSVQPVEDHESAALISAANRKFLRENLRRKAGSGEIVITYQPPTSIIPLPYEREHKSC